MASSRQEKAYVAEELGDREDAIQVSVAIDEARYEDLSSGIDNLGARADGVTGLGADVGDLLALYRNANIGLDLARVNIDQIPVYNRQIGVFSAKSRID